MIAGLWPSNIPPTDRRISGRSMVVAAMAAIFFVTTARSAELEQHPLETHSAGEGKTMFTLLAPETTGLRTENRYDDPAMWNQRYHEFEIGPIGTGVAIGDYDGDGRPDIFVVSKTESGRLFRNLGNWKFEDVTEKAGVSDRGDAARVWKQGVTFADVNNDGRLDLYVCRFDAPNLLYINQGDGTFKEQAKAAGLDVKDASTQAAFCDYDRDGWLDVYVQTNLLNNSEHPSGQRDYLFHNNRDGTFTNVSDRAGILRTETQGNSATWWDFDDDGWPDLYVANDFAVPDFLYRNNHDGTFTNVIDSVVPHMPYSSMGSDIADLNNDGRIDFMVADMAATNHEKDQRTMADTRARTKDPLPEATAVPTYLRNAVYLNTGTGRALEAAYLLGLTATDWTWSLRFEDLDNDGRLDLFVTNGMHREIHNTDLIFRMMSAESAQERIRIARGSPILNEPNLAFRNLGDLRFESVGPAWGLDQKGVSFGAALGDLDGDGDLDVVYSNFLTGATVARNDSSTGHRLVVRLHGTVSNRFGIGAIVTIETASGRQIRQLELARGYMSSSEPMVHFGLGEDDLVKRLEVRWPSGHAQVFENVRVDQRLEVAEPSASVQPASRPIPVAGQFSEIGEAANFALRSREETIDEIAQQRFLPTRLNRRGPALAVGRLTKDGGECVLLGGTTQDPLRIVRLESAKRFSPSASLGNPAPVNDGPVLVFDANGDGSNDVLITRGGNSLPAGAAEYEPLLLLNDGQGGFHRAPDGSLPSLANSVGAVAAADFNRDGQLDLFIGGRVSPGQYPDAAVSALLVNHEGRFENATESLATGLANIGMVTGALWSDVDRDGWPDLLLTIEWGSVRYFHNEQGKRFEDWTEKGGFTSGGTGWWTGIAAADFNGDGQVDYVVGNVGLNTQYRADRTHPALLFSGDFKGDGMPQLIEGYYEGDKLYPWRTRRDLGAAVPSILKRFPRNDAYARATLEEIVGEKVLAKAERFAATELSSGVFLSQTDGTYRFTSLPRLAQIAPFQGLVAGNFDGDGQADIYAAQNSYAPNPVVGRFDGGLSQLLRGDGHGAFTASAAAETQLIVPGDAKAVATIDLDDDGWPDFLVSRNNSTTLAFRNNGISGRHSLRVVLHGSRGNPDAIGARVVARSVNGATQTMELVAGSGYYTQSSACCFFGALDTNPIKSIEIHWPTGTTTHHDVPAASHALEFVSP